jgi:hypothetical protein
MSPPDTDRTLPRVSGLSAERFFSEFLTRNRPFVCTDVIARWPGGGRDWTIPSFRKRFGSVAVTLQQDFFEAFAGKKLTFAEYTDQFPRYESAVTPDGSVTEAPPYLRYSNEPGEFGDIAYGALKSEWANPYFMPDRGYIVPFSPSFIDPTKSRFPDFGIYVSPRGAVTRLHVDGDRSNALLCQVAGKKRCILFPPESWPLLPRDWVNQKLSHYNILGPPRFPVKTLEVILEAGDTLFIPRSWFHEVYTLEASISLTYNFVHWRDAGIRVGVLPSYYHLMAARFVVTRVDALAQRIFLGSKSFDVPW